MHWSERTSCLCGKTFKIGTMAEARHRHNFPTLCRPKKASGTKPGKVHLKVRGTIRTVNIACGVALDREPVSSGVHMSFGRRKWTVSEDREAVTCKACLRNSRQKELPL